MNRDTISYATKRGVLKAVANGLSTTEIRKKFNLKHRNNIYEIKKAAQSIPEIIQKNWTALLELSQANTKRRIRIIKGASEELLEAVIDCCSNLVKGVVPLCDSQLEIIRNYKKNIRRFIEPGRRPSSIRRYLVKRGDFIPAVLKPILDFYQNGQEVSQGS